MGSDHSEQEQDNEPSNLISIEPQTHANQQHFENEEGNRENDSENSESDNSSDAKVIINLDFDDEDEEQLNDAQINDGKLSLFPFPRYDYFICSSD